MDISWPDSPWRKSTLFTSLTLVVTARIENSRRNGVMFPAPFLIIYSCVVVAAEVEARTVRLLEKEEALASGEQQLQQFDAGKLENAIINLAVNARRAVRGSYCCR